MAQPRSAELHPCLILSHTLAISFLRAIEYIKDAVAAVQWVQSYCRDGM